MYFWTPQKQPAPRATLLEMPLLASGAGPALTDVSEGACSPVGVVTFVAVVDCVQPMLLFIVRLKFVVGLFSDVTFGSVQYCEEAMMVDREKISVEPFWLGKCDKSCFRFFVGSGLFLCGQARFLFDSRVTHEP